jgi:hypothetical protein
MEEIERRVRDNPTFRAFPKVLTDLQGNNCDRCNVFSAYVRILMTEAEAKEQKATTLQLTKRRAEINLQLCRAEIYTNKKNAVQQLIQMDNQIRQLEQINQALVEENRVKQDALDKFECAVTMQVTLAQAGRDGYNNVP